MGMTKAGRSRATAGRRGTAAVELALTLPLLLTIVLGCVDFGRFAHTYIAVTNAARVGAAYGSMNPVTTTTLPTWQQNIRQAVLDELGSAFDPSKVELPAPVITTESSNQKRVHVEVAYPFRTIVNWPFLPAGARNCTLRRAVEMRFVR